MKHLNALDRNVVRLPAEWETHHCCWLAWAIHPEWQDWTEKVARELSAVIRTISRFELVRLLTPSDRLADAKARFAGNNVEIVEAPVDDIWMRDIAPTFALRGSEVISIDWNFNGWGSTSKRSARAGDRLAEIAADIFLVPRVSAPFIAEGGALVTDGEGTLITTRSCLLNPNRNPVRIDETQERVIERELTTFGIRRVVWLEGDPCEPVTSGHVDGYVMFTAPGTVMVEAIDNVDAASPLWRDHDIALLEQTQDAFGRTIRVERLSAPRKRFWRFRGKSWAPCYLNAYVANGGVITASFGDAERDEAAKKALERTFLGRSIVMLRIDHIANGGGGIRCLTQPMPAVPIQPVVQEGAIQ